MELSVLSNATHLRFLYCTYRRAYRESGILRTDGGWLWSWMQGDTAVVVSTYLAFPTGAAAAPDSASCFPNETLGQKMLKKTRSETRSARALRFREFVRGPPPSHKMGFYVYWIQSGARAYIGATVNPTKRLRQHNGEIRGGALRTRNRGPWRFHCVISGFRTWKEALQYEWAAKYYSRRCRSIDRRQLAIEQLNQRERWTSNSPPSSEIPLNMEYSPSQYGQPPEVYAPRPLQKMLKRKEPKQFKKLPGVSY